jgi:hypothetical protein
MTKAADEARAAYRRWCRRSQALAADLSQGRDTDGSEWPSFPDMARDLRCGARTRAGTPCLRRDLQSNGRCRLHGGLSTGPKTDAGRKRARANLAVRWRRGSP